MEGIHPCMLDIDEWRATYTPPDSALPVIWSIFLYLADPDYAPIERGGIAVHDGIWLMVRMLMMVNQVDYTVCKTVQVYETFDASLRPFSASTHSLTGARTKPPVGLGQIHKQRITSGARRVENVQRCGSRWLLLVRHIAMSRHGRCARFKEDLTRTIIRSTVHEVNFRMPFGCTARWMDMVARKVSSKSQSVLNR